MGDYEPGPGALLDGAFPEALSRISPVSALAAEEGRSRQDTLTKPPGALGLLETVGIQLCAISGQCPPPLPLPAAVAVFAGDHGVLAEGVSPWPSEVTAQMVANFVSGGAAINVLARQVGAEVVVVDVGVAADPPTQGGYVDAKVRRGTGNIAVEAAMTLPEARRCLDVGAGLAADLVRAGFRCLATGDMGIGNTTPSAALIAAFCDREAREVTGRGTGIDDSMLANKVSVVERALGRALGRGPGGGAEYASGGAPGPAKTIGGDRAGSRPTDGGWGLDDQIGLLASLGGLEIAALAGFVVGGASLGVPVVVDGVIALAAAVAAAAMAPDCKGYLIAGHRSSEPGASVALDHLGLDPLLDLSFRLGEGTGACLALPVVQAAARVLAEMATFDSAGVAKKAP